MERTGVWLIFTGRKGRLAQTVWAADGTER